MDEHILQNLENFEALWQRVSQSALPLPPTAANPSPGEQESLSALIGRTNAAARRYEQLAALFPAPSQRSALARRAKEEAAQGRRLAGEYFLRFGKRKLGSPKPAAPMPRLELLRAAYWAALDSAKQFDSAAGHSEDSLAGLYRQYAADERRRAEENRKLLLQVF